MGSGGKGSGFGCFFSRHGHVRFRIIIHFHHGLCRRIAVRKRGVLNRIGRGSCNGYGVRNNGRPGFNGENPVTFSTPEKYEDNGDDGDHAGQRPPPDHFASIPQRRGRGGALSGVRNQDLSFVGPIQTGIQDFGSQVDQGVDERPGGGIVCPCFRVVVEGCTFIGARNQHVPVDAATDALPRCIYGEITALPQRKADIETEVILSSRLNVTV